jgi:hypothetical protein
LLLQENWDSMVKLRKLLRARRIRREGFGKHISNKQLIEFHEQLAKDTHERNLWVRAARNLPVVTDSGQL